MNRGVNKNGGVMSAVRKLKGTERQSGLFYREPTTFRVYLRLDSEEDAESFFHFVHLQGMTINRFAERSGIRFVVLCVSRSERSRLESNGYILTEDAKAIFGAT